MKAVFSAERRGDDYVVKKQTGGVVQYLYYGDTVKRYSEDNAHYEVETFSTHSDTSLFLTESWREAGTVYQGGVGVNRLGGASCASL
jgi:hypothetical protein